MWCVSNLQHGPLPRCLSPAAAAYPRDPFLTRCCFVYACDGRAARTARYQVNITDVDDKIIMRSRRNKLHADYVAAKSSNQAACLEYITGAMDTNDAKLIAKLAKVKELLPADAPSREKEERKEQIAIQILKNSQVRSHCALCAVSCVLCS